MRWERGTEESRDKRKTRSKRRRETIEIEGQVEEREDE
jgi:hypothetical protein